jgi:hypothetical protein
MQNVALLNILLLEVGVVHSFEYSGTFICDMMKSRTMLCKFYKELSIPVFGEEKNQNQRTMGSGYFKNLKELVGFS